MTAQLAAYQLDELRRLRDLGAVRIEAADRVRSPWANLLRRNLIALSPADGAGMYRITESGRALVGEELGDTRMTGTPIPPYSNPRDCPVCFGINPIVTTVIARDGSVTGTTSIRCGGCGASTEENKARRRETPE